MNDASLEVRARMRDDWNERAREDAHYYVAFGRRNQSDDEFFATGREQVRAIEFELQRLPPARPRARRALEIGCGPGRLMRPLSRHFGEIHGVDISDEMIRRAREKLAGVPHAHAHHAPDSDLSAFADESFDLVYSYAVFQHIPSRAVVMNYLDEAARVLTPGGVIRCQLNGLPKTARVYDTWAGVRISSEEVHEFALRRGLRLLALEGKDTQYMWITLRKPPSPWKATGATCIRRITNAHSSEPVAPVRGRFAALSLWIENLAEDADLNSIEVKVGGSPGFVTHVGHPERDGLQQVNLLLPEGLRSGLHPVEIAWRGAAQCARATVRLTPPGPPVPRVLSLTDGIDLLAGSRIVTGSCKATLEEIGAPERIGVKVGGRPAEEIEYFCTDPRLPRYEVNFRLPAGTPAGPSPVRISLGERTLGDVWIEVAVVE